MMRCRARQVIAFCLALTVALTAGCATPPPATLPPAPTVTPQPTHGSGASPLRVMPPAPLSLPRDESPHDVLTEWWYYTGHLAAATGETFGFEFVVFQVRLGDGGPTYLSHAAVTDLARGRFTYDQRAVSGAQSQPADGGFALAVGDWTMRGNDGHDRVSAAVPGYAFDLAVDATKPPALHVGSGYISFGPAGDSYYYSRTRMAVTGTIVDHGVTLPVTGTAWFDKQWGDFLSVKGGGWDWYALQLDDGVDIMLFDVRDQAGRVAATYGSYVDSDGAVRNLPSGAYTVEPTGHWTSPHTAATYPSGWRVRLPAEHLEVTVTPLVADQELDTRATTGVVYWEGAVRVTGLRAGRPVSGRGYAELTGYAR